MKCNGLFGLIFGHKYVSVYDTDEEEFSAEDKIKITEAASNSFISYESEKKLMGGVHRPKRVSQIYKGHYCKRCGDVKEQKFTL